MERIKTLFLKITVVVIGLIMLALCVFFLPMLAREGAEYFPAESIYPLVIVMYIATIPFFVALYQSLKLLSYIDKNIAFSERSVKALKIIKYCACSISLLFVIVLPFLYQMAEFDDAPGIIVIGLVIIFASTVIAVFAAVLQKLLKNAIDIKSENDLTI